jgi:hypothetical protein
MKTAGRAIVRQQYDFFPPNNLSREQYIAHVKTTIEELLREGQFLRNGHDNQVRFELCAEQSTKHDI